MNILNYQGNKTKLLKFINQYCKSYIQDGKAVLDIFSGGGAVCSDFAKSYVTYANDLEPYSSQISKAFICKPQYCDFDETFYCKFESAFKGQSSKLIKAYESFVEEEKLILKSKSAEALINFYQRVPTFWNHLTSPLLKQKITSSAIVNRAEKYCLFTLLYPTSYFSLMQTIEIDALRRAIDETDQKYNTAYLNTCLFHAMNMTVFSKDGHMAQPLNLEKNTARGFKRKSLSISDVFFEQLKHYQDLPDVYSEQNLVFNKDFVQLLNSNDPNLANVGFIYADPPYTDMQYSRYYHLLNIAFEYQFSEPTVIKGKYSSGLYLSDRNQSKISERRSFLKTMTILFDYCVENHINLAISFGYPDVVDNEKTNRYLASIDELTNAAAKAFGSNNITLKGQQYQHSNQRKSNKKKVIEYLILCRGDNNAR